MHESNQLARAMEHAVEVDTQSAGFSILTFTLRHAHPRAEGSWEPPICAQDTHRRTHNARNPSDTRHFFYTYTASGSQPNRRAARRRQSRRRRPEGAPVPPGASHRAAAPPQLPPRSSRPPRSDRHADAVAAELVARSRRRRRPPGAAPPVRCCTPHRGSAPTQMPFRGGG